MITADAIHDALIQGQFFLEYLPTISLADGRCVGAEALARWPRSSGMVQPDEFMPFIEGTYLSGLLTIPKSATNPADLRPRLPCIGEAVATDCSSIV